MTRVLGLITFRIYPTLMGGQKGVALFYEHLQKYIDVVLAVSSNNKLPNELPFPARAVLYSNKQVFLNLFHYGVLKKLLRHHKSNIIIAEHSYAGWLAWLLKWQTGLPFILHSHNLEALRFKHMHRRWWKLYWRYEGWIHRKADFNFFISDDDKAYAVGQFRLDEKKCATVTYGVAPFVQQATGKKQLLEGLGLNDSYFILFFNGTLDYEPNREAVYALGHEVIPRLRKKMGLFKILISGNRSSQTLRNFMAKLPELIYLDYVPDVSIPYQAAQLFINPILNNTGVKTKVLEAIANQCTVVSTNAGATGICKALCAPKLITVADGDWDDFANNIAEQLYKPHEPTPAAFYNFYLWDVIARNAAANITETIQRHAAT